ncbi:juvenile hormone acid O-methyltransferase-like [Oppia nitens]|uniref:juvenile hormone acid O-methyltransferase-like n=1 Tax=Oppia nitens TaxID=1686743 RepID=UPI0023DC7AFD|nr:juvenile hormone acid O-methyltransferase-like [Oppia nitens]
MESIKQLNIDNRSYDLIVDLGCGDGGITKHLFGKHIRYKLLVGIDVVPEMISYARRHNTADTIEYVEQDMSIGWPEISSQRIRQLDGTVDLIVSNFALHYMPDKWQVMNTCSRLLSSSSSSTTTTGGIFHANIVILADLNKKLVTTNTPKQWYPTIDKQIADWKQSIIDNQLDIKQLMTIDYDWTIDRQITIDFMPVIQSNYRSFFKNQSDFEAELNDHLSDTVFDAFVNPTAPDPNPKSNGC